MISRPLCCFLSLPAVIAFRTDEGIQDGLDAEDRSWDFTHFSLAEVQVGMEAEFGERVELEAADGTHVGDWLEAEFEDGVEAEGNASRCDGMMGTVPYLQRQWQMAVAPPSNRGVIVMQFNVLADGMGQNQFGAAARPHPGRFEAALAEIKEVAPDVLCMQEGNRFDDFWKPRMQALGYDSVWMPKNFGQRPSTSLGVPPAYYRGAPSDGSAIFVKRDRYKLGKTATTRFSDIGVGGTQVIATAEVLEKDSGRHVLTASTSHLKAGGHFTMRLHQGKSWARFMQRQGFREPFVLTGDFNEDRKGHPRGGVNHLMTALALRDTYELGLGKYPAFTSRWGTFDYILASAQLRPRKLWSIPADRNRLPSSCYPSDHLALAVELVTQ